MLNLKFDYYLKIIYFFIKNKIIKRFFSVSKKDFVKIALNNPEFTQNELNKWIEKYSVINDKNTHHNKNYTNVSKLSTLEQKKTL